MAIRDYCGRQPQIAPSAFVDEMALVIGDVVIGTDSSVWPMSVIRGDVQPIRIGARTNIQDGSVLHVTGNDKIPSDVFPLQIGNAVTIGHGAILHACTIGDMSLIGIGAIVLDGAIVSGGTMVGANSLVPPGKQLEGGFLWLGSPVKKIRELNENEKRFLKFSAEHYVELKNKHRT